MAKGIIYLMSTCVEGLVKIGRTGSNNYEQRMLQLENNGYRKVPVLTREFAIEVEDFEEKENLLKDIFPQRRVGKSELFAIDINLAKQLISSFAGKVIYPKDESKNEFFAHAQEESEVKKGVIPEGLYTFKKKINGNLHLVEATLKVESGKLFIEAGSRLAPITKITNKGWIKIRESVKMDNYIIQERIECKSPSMAAAIVCGHNKNGWKTWKNSNGDYIDIYRKKEVQNED